MKSFEGIFTALITPFRKGEIDYQSFSRLLKAQMDAKVNGFVVIGTTAESPTLSFDERKAIFTFVKKEVGSAIPLIVGTGTNSTSGTIMLSQEAQKWGADGVLTATPYFNKPPQRGLVEHFRQVANAISIPMLLYNVPSRTVTGLTLETIKTLSAEKNIIGIKEATGDVEFGRSIYQKCGNDFLITGGDDATWLKLCSVGGRGVISVMSHVIPAAMLDLYSRLGRGDSAALQDAEQFNNLEKLLFVETNPIAVKAALKMMGLIDSDELRLPLVPLADEYREPLRRVLERLDLIK